MAPPAGKMVIEFSVTDRRLLERIAKGVEKQNSLSTPPAEFHDEGTLNKVYDALRDQLGDEFDLIGIVSAIQNNGILFRERR